MLQFDAKGGSDIAFQLPPSGFLYYFYLDHCFIYYFFIYNIGAAEVRPSGMNAGDPIKGANSRKG